MSGDVPVLLERDGALAVLTINRPSARNAVDDTTRAALLAALGEIAADRSVSVLILTGAGTAFCAGGDVASMQQRLEQPPGQVAVNGWQRQHGTAALTQTLHRLDQVTIAAVNGPAVGLGLDLALACDFIVASPEARFAASFVNRGLVPDGGGMYHLPRRVGLQRAKELMFSGRMVASEEASRLGLVDEPVDGPALDAARKYAERFLAQPRASLMLTKSIVNRTYELPLEQIAALGGQAQAICYTTDDHRDSVRTFLAKRSRE